MNNPEALVIPALAGTATPFTSLEQCIYAALETYSNVHRGSGHNSVVSTRLYEGARKTVLEYLGLPGSLYSVIFCTPLRAAKLTAQLRGKDYKSVSSQDFGLAIGLTALAVKKSALPAGAPFETGGGTTRLMSKDWVLWAKGPDKFEPGTPAIINVIALAKALQLRGKPGQATTADHEKENLSTDEILYQDELRDYAGRQLLEQLRQTLIGRDMEVPTPDGSKPYINLDNSASTPTFVPVWNAFRKTMLQPDAVKKQIVKEVKSICAGFLGAPQSEYEVIFTSNTTEAINLAAESLGREFGPETEPVVINSLLEHSSNDLPWRMLPGGTLLRLSIDNEGFIDLKELESLLKAYNRDERFGKKRVRLVAISGASNVLGTCNDLTEISRIVHRYDARLLVDAAQLVAHREVKMEQTGIDYLAFSAHKIYAPFGTGALVVRKGLLVFSQSEMDQIRSSGEENAGGIAALGKALLLVQRIGMDSIADEESALIRRTLTGLASIPGLQTYGLSDPDSPVFHRKTGVMVFSLKGKMANQISRELAARSAIGTRYGCHCAHILIKHILGVSPGLETFQRRMLMVLPNLRLPGVARVSFGLQNTPQEVDTLIHSLIALTGNRHPATGNHQPAYGPASAPAQ